jgi:hypothetical protein
VTADRKRSRLSGQARFERVEVRERDEPVDVALVPVSRGAPS